MKHFDRLAYILNFFIWISFLVVTLKPCYSSPSPTVWNLSKANVFFVGREEKLQDIRSFFKKGERDILALTGGPGFGKTQIAKKYAQQFRKDYTLVWWIDIQQDIPNQFKKLAIALNHILPDKDKIIPSTLSKEALVDRVKDILRMMNIRYLLIFDNAENYDQIEKYIPNTYQQSGKHILLTSRYANIWTDKVEINKFNRSESICLIKKNLPKVSTEEAKKLAESLSDYPLGLTLAIGFIKASPTTTIDKYLSMHMKRTLGNRENHPSIILDRYSNDARAALEISLRSIEEDSQDALKALLFMSLLNSKDIPETYIELWLKKTNSSLTADEAIKYVYAQSIIDVSETSRINNKNSTSEKERVYYLSIHDLIHQLIQESMKMEDKRKLIGTATDVMFDVFSGPSEVFTRKIIEEPIHLLHAQKLCKNAKEAGYSSLKLLHLKICMLQCLMSALRDFEAAELLLKDIEIDLNTGLQPEPYYKALYEVNKGFLESLYTRYDSAIKHMKEGLALFEAYDRPQEEKLRALTNLIQYHAMQGEIEKAEEIMHTAQPLFQNTLSVVPKSFFLYASSIVLNDQGKFKAAEETLNKADDFTNLSKESPTIDHAILLQKSSTFIKQNNLESAKKTLQECERKTRAFFHGRSNSSLSHILLLRSLIAIEEGKISSETFQNLEKALLVYKDFFKGEKKQRNQARTYFAIGKAHTLQQNFKKALDQYLISEEIFNKVLKNRKIDDVSELYKEFVILGTKLKNEEMVHKYLMAHINTFGRAHPRTLEILLYLDKNGIPVPS